MTAHVKEAALHVTGSWLESHLSGRHSAVGTHKASIFLSTTAWLRARYVMTVLIHAQLRVPKDS
jgi:hypothetical protein